MNRVLADLHSVDVHAVGLDDYGRPGNYFARQIHRWTQQYRASETEKIEAMESLIEWLPGHVPDPATTVARHTFGRFDRARSFVYRLRTSEGCAFFVQ